MQDFQCLSCKHYRGYLKCDAYPDGIPEPLLEGTSHKMPYPGDNGIRWEPANEFAADMDARIHHLKKKKLKRSK